jgi:two-component system, cell cycle response regulator
MKHPTKRHRVLMVEDSRAALDLYCARLERRGYVVSGASSAEQAREVLATTPPDIVLLDIFMPKVSGFDLLREMRSTPCTATVPVILTSALSDTKHIVEGLALGANDYVTKPIVMPILTARMEGLLRSAELVRRLEVQTELLSKLAAFDELTGVYNRRSLFHHLEAELSRCERYGRSLSLLMLDVDHFKRVNDEYGHLAGDAALRSIATTLQSVLRVMDLVCRYGGEEFCVILPETNEVGACRAAERLRTGVERSVFTHASHPVPLTVSIGVASWTDTRTSGIPDLLARADEALLEAKQRGRNQVRLAGRIGRLPTTA